MVAGSNGGNGGNREVSSRNGNGAAKKEKHVLVACADCRMNEVGKWISIDCGGDGVPHQIREVGGAAGNQEEILKDIRFFLSLGPVRGILLTVHEGCFWIAEQPGLSKKPLEAILQEAVESLTEKMGRECPQISAHIISGEGHEIDVRRVGLFQAGTATVSEDETDVSGSPGLESSQTGGRGVSP